MQIATVPPEKAAGEKLSAAPPDDAHPWLPDQDEGIFLVTAEQPTGP